ncbi:MAG: type II toxin-antitoxin system VapC family toxin [Deltaproteobacteria bacterium]|nr:type II toxin-antitoxin system VapC family toxin [Nannocystaceae bacterium]
MATPDAARPRVYLETSVLSYLTARPSRDVVRIAHQQITAEWWVAREAFELFLSDVVLDEIRQGDAGAAERRIEASTGLLVLTTTPSAENLAASLLSAAALPARAALDALHVANAAIHGMHFLLTWNCAHIANAAMRPRIETVCRSGGYEPPIICTPEELQTWGKQ